jgi:hypothetical protein
MFRGQRAHWGSARAYQRLRLDELAHGSLDGRLGPRRRVELDSSLLMNAHALRRAAAIYADESELLDNPARDGPVIVIVRDR